MKLKVCWSIEGQNIQIQNQGSKWNRLPTLGLMFEFGKDAIELILKINISIEDLIEIWGLIWKYTLFGAIFF
jgi:hypothetical protein